MDDELYPECLLVTDVRIQRSPETANIAYALDTFEPVVIYPPRYPAINDAIFTCRPATVQMALSETPHDPRDPNRPELYVRLNKVIEQNVKNMSLAQENAALHQRLKDLEAEIVALREILELDS